MLVFVTLMYLYLPTTVSIYGLFYFYTPNTFMINMEITQATLFFKIRILNTQISVHTTIIK